jgi:hypothetical protein
MSTDPTGITPERDAETGGDGDAVEWAAGLVTAASVTGGGDDSELQSELDRVFPKLDDRALELRQLLAALAGLGAQAVDRAARPSPGAEVSEEVDRRVVLDECVATLRALGLQREQTSTLAEDHPEPTVERRSGLERRTGERRRHEAGSPPARVAVWLHGERREGPDPRTGGDRRAATGDGD